MANKSKEIQYAIAEWQKATGEYVDIDMHEVVKYAVEHLGWPLPNPVSPYDMLAKEFSRAAREETRQDAKTGQNYRVFHAYTEANGQRTLWGDIDKLPRKKMAISARNRREQVIGDMVQLEIDLNHWNRVNPNEEPIPLVKDLTEDVAERLAGPDAAAA